MAISKHMVHIHIYCDGSLFSWHSRWGKPWNLERQREAFFVGLHTERAMFLYQRRWDKNLWSRISHPHKSRARSTDRLVLVRKDTALLRTFLIHVCILEVILNRHRNHWNTLLRCSPALCCSQLSADPLCPTQSALYDQAQASTHGESSHFDKER